MVLCYELNQLTENCIVIMKLETFDMHKNSEWSELLFTDNLKIIPARTEHVCAELEAPDRLAEMLDAVVEDGWPPGEYDRSAQEFFRDTLQSGGDELVGWLCWYALRKAEKGRRAVLVGAGGFLGKPDENGKVEIGFSLMPQWRGQGLACEMVKALVENAFADSRTSAVSAHTTEGNLAARRVLEKAGFSLIESETQNGIVLYEKQTTDGVL